jgi:hypothetical protein
LKKDLLHFKNSEIKKFLFSKTTKRNKGQLQEAFSDACSEKKLLRKLFSVRFFGQKFSREFFDAWPLILCTSIRQSLSLCFCAAENPFLCQSYYLEALCLLPKK